MGKGGRDSLAAEGDVDEQMLSAEVARDGTVKGGEGCRRLYHMKDTAEPANQSSIP